jgi:integrase/recombinase XerD
VQRDTNGERLHGSSSRIIKSDVSMDLSPALRVRLRDVSHLARFLHAEDPRHEVPHNPYLAATPRRLPYIYAPEEIGKLLRAASGLRESYPLRRRIYATMLGLIAATGLRISEALSLRIKDILHDGVLHIRRTKFGKSRMVPLHSTVVDAVNRYLVEHTFNRLRELAGIVPVRSRPPRIHDLRHTFATRALERCSTQRDEVARHFVALATYMGHSDIAHTFWYLEATPDLMTGIAVAAEALVAGEGL